MTQLARQYASEGEMKLSQVQAGKETAGFIGCFRNFDITKVQPLLFDINIDPGALEQLYPKAPGTTIVLKIAFYRALRHEDEARAGPQKIE